MTKAAVKLAGLGLLLVAAWACDSSRVYEKNYEIPENTWEVHNRLSFDVNIKDTLSRYNFLFNLRNTTGYKYSNFYFFFHTVSPSGQMAKDTVHCILADQSGRWLGSGNGDVIDNQVLFKHKVQFQESGKYHFEIEQAMREEKIKHIPDVGLRIEKAQ